MPQMLEAEQISALNIHDLKCQFKDCDGILLMKVGEPEQAPAAETGQAGTGQADVGSGGGEQ